MRHSSRYRRNIDSHFAFRALLDSNVFLWILLLRQLIFSIRLDLSNHHVTLLLLLNRLLHLDSEPCESLLLKYFKDVNIIQIELLIP